MTSAPRRSWAFAALIAALSMLGPFSIDMYLPAFPAIGREFGASPIALQQTLSVYMFAFAFMMLWHGALSDALGRRPVLIGSLIVYAFATLGCALAGSIESLWFFRALQGTSSGAGVVIGRAIIRDRYQGPEAQRLMSQVTVVFGIAPALAPVLGGAMLALAGWRSLFWLLLVLVVALTVWTVRSVPETLPREQRHELHPLALWANYRAVASKIDFLLLALIPTLNFCAFFIYIASAPTFLIDLLGLSTLGFAWLFVPMIAGVMCGAMMSGRLAGRTSPLRTIRIGYAIMFGGVALNLALCWLVAPGVPWSVLPIFVFTCGSSLATPSLTIVLLDLFPRIRGMASSLQGFVQFAVSGVTAGTIVPLVAGSVKSLALGMAGFTVAAFAAWLIYQYRARAFLRSWRP